MSATGQKLIAGVVSIDLKPQTVRAAKALDFAIYVAVIKNRGTTPRVWTVAVTIEPAAGAPDIEAFAGWGLVALQPRQTVRLPVTVVVGPAPTPGQEVGLHVRITSDADTLEVWRHFTVLPSKRRPR